VATGVENLTFDHSQAENNKIIDDYMEARKTETNISKTMKD
jgi:hypothetical protein